MGDVSVCGFMCVVGKGRRLTRTRQTCVINAQNEHAHKVDTGTNTKSESASNGKRGSFVGGLELGVKGFCQSSESLLIFRIVDIGQ